MKFIVNLGAGDNASRAVGTELSVSSARSKATLKTKMKVRAELKVD